MSCNTADDEDDLSLASFTAEQLAFSAAEFFAYFPGKTKEDLVTSLRQDLETRFKANPTNSAGYTAGLAALQQADKEGKLERHYEPQARTRS